MKRPEQPGLFGPAADDDHAPGSSPAGPLPRGFRYQADLISPADEKRLLDHLQVLPFKEFEFYGGFKGKRRIVSFGWRYDYGDRELQRAEDIPPFLFPLRERAAAFANLQGEDLRHVLLTEYSPGAAIGWHRDKAVFDQVIGVSLLAPCRLRFRRKRGNFWERAAITADPRSAYLLAGPARSEWEHSIPPVDRLRYSITFRNFARR